MNRYKSIISFALAAAFSAGQVSGQSADDLVKLVLENNPALAQTAMDANAELLELKTENKLPSTELEFSRKWGNLGEKKLGFGVTQGFDWPGLYAARSAAAGALARVQTARLMVRQADLEQQTRELIISAVAHKKRIELLGKLSAGFDSMLQGAVKERERGAITIIDLNKIELQASRASVSLSQAKAALEETLATLSLLAGTDVEMQSLPDTFPMAELKPLDVYLAAAGESSPEVIEAATEADFQRQRRKVAAREGLPGFSLGYEFEREGEQTFNGLSVGIELPIFSARGRTTAANASVLAAEFNAATVKNNLSRKVTSNYKTAESLRKEMNAMGPVLDRYDNFSLLNRLFEGRQISLSDYILDVNYFLEASLDYIDVCEAYHAALLPLQRYCRE